MTAAEPAVAGARGMLILASSARDRGIGIAAMSWTGHGLDVLASGSAGTARLASMLGLRPGPSGAGSWQGTWWGMDVTVTGPVPFGAVS